jgi:hypothetical protein
MTGPVILMILGGVLAVYGGAARLRHSRAATVQQPARQAPPLRAVARLVWDVAVVLVKGAVFAAVILAPPRSTPKAPPLRLEDARRTIAGRKPR